MARYRAPVNGYGRNDGETVGEYILWTDARREPQKTRADKRALNIPFETASVIRQPAEYKDRANYEGFYWMAATDGHVWYESFEEMTSLKLLDHHGTIRAISTQPMQIYFDDGSDHTPDFFAVHTDGSRTVYDSKHSSRIKGKVATSFENTRRVCKRIGWDYQVITELTRVQRHNLDWIGYNRHPRYAPTAERRERILAAAQAPTALGELLLADHRPHEIYHLMWKRELLFDATAQLTLNTILERTHP
ncbi:TnsA-like heteromeric transposase endonuclease subunit [Leifsonia shinshuensis]|uniref:TnsA-like heteromeric transposase endonuclease subunit n=1 Tax=Leifsonia shinshuensis TaxID=150026 RepID=A0A853CZI9_9MICO|nr:TnsA-like heteromeric transposase endonuclease subunit [Leifsonia shinshuensis]NYJ25599.1 hypothetical protein [Leifsonia shinshuensis]